MLRQVGGRLVFPATLGALVLAVGLLPIAAAAGDDQVPDDVRSAITEVLEKKVSDLFDQRNAQGVANVRAAFSHAYKKVDDSTYTVSFEKFTAEKELEKVERLLLTIKKGAAGKWEVAKEDLQHSFGGLRRVTRDRDEYYNFDQLTFDHYGMKVTATKGSAFLTYFMDKPNAITVVADDLAYTYTPPKNMNYYAMYESVMLKEYPEEFVFRPEQAQLRGDGDSMAALLASSFTGLRKAAKGETVPKLQKLVDDALRQYEKDLKDDPFLGFRPPFRDDHRTWDLSLKRASGEELWLWLDYDNYEGWDVNFGSSKRGLVFGYYSDELLAKGPSPYDLERREDSDARWFDLDSLVGKVDIGLEDEEAIEGDLNYELTIKQKVIDLPFRISRLHRPSDEAAETKSPKMTINILQDGDGNDLTWVKTGPYSARIVFPKPLEPGQKVKLRMAFRNLDSIYKVNPSYSAMDRLGWIPFVRFTDPVEHFDMTVRVKDKYRALGPGKKVLDKKENGCQVTRWVSENPVSFPTVIFGDYIDSGPSKGVVAKRADGTEIPVRVYVDKVSTNTLDETTFKSQEDYDDRMAKAEGGARGIRAKSLTAIADMAANALNLYRVILGQEYKYDKLDLVCDPLGEFYGQAPASIIYLGFAVFRGEGWVATLGAPSATDISKFNKDVVPHETGHQWWGGLVGNMNERNYWFVESLTEYMAALDVENTPGRGRKAYDEKVAEWRRTILKYEILNSVQNASSLWGGEMAGGAYLSNVYNRGPYGFHVLRETFGDEKFYRFLKELASEFAEKQMVTRDIQQVAEKVFGGNMEWFFDEWFRGVGLPQFALLYDVRQTEDGKFLVEGKIKQRVVAGKKEIEIPNVYYRSAGWLTFEFADGKQMKYPPAPAAKGEATKLFVVQGAETPFKVKLPEKPVAVHFNKDGEILAHDTLENRSW